MHKNALKSLLIICTFLFLTSCGVNKVDAPTKETTSPSNLLITEQIDAYKINTEPMYLISPKKFKKLLETTFDKPIFVCFDRLTCSACRIFIAELNYFLHSNTPTIYYIDTENTDTDSGIQNIRDKYNIEVVPAFIKFDTISMHTYSSEQNNLADFINNE